MQLFRTEMLFLHPPQPVAPRVRYGQRHSAPRYGHARVRPHETPPLPVPPVATPDQSPGRASEPAHVPALDLERAA
jgi:hypothetical protein